MGTITAIEGLVELGMTPSQAIVAATKNGALACRMTKDLGTVETGKLADLLILDADPLANIANIRKRRTVIGRRAGRGSGQAPREPDLVSPTHACANLAGSGSLKQSVVRTFRCAP